MIKKLFLLLVFFLTQSFFDTVFAHILHYQQLNRLESNLYRNNQLITTILKTCKSSTLLCIASNITLPSEKIKTRTILEWQKANINIHKKPAIFLIS